jgi:hypothetical protein
MMPEGVVVVSVSWLSSTFVAFKKHSPPYMHFARLTMMTIHKDNYAYKYPTSIILSCAYILAHVAGPEGSLV